MYFLQRHIPKTSLPRAPNSSTRQRNKESSGHLKLIVILTEWRVHVVERPYLHFRDYPPGTQHNDLSLASTDNSGIIKYLEPNMNNLTAWQGSSSRETFRGLSSSPDDRRFATASDDSSAWIWSFAESRVESMLTGHG